jgi:hypothetical protein
MSLLQIQPVATHDAQEQIFLGYGFERVETQGVWTMYGEHTSFTPAHGAPGNWQLVWLPNVKTNIAESAIDYFKGSEFNVRVVGYVGAVGRYGHLGYNDRQLYATSVMRSKSK